LAKNGVKTRVFKRFLKVKMRFLRCF